MKKLTILFLLIISILSSYSQCGFDVLVFVELGKSKLEVQKEVFLYNDASYHDSQFDDKWYTPDYLDGDSVYLSSLRVNIGGYYCFNNKKAEVTFWFANDVLYEINTSISYAPEDMKECLIVFNRVKGALDNRVKGAKDALLEQLDNRVKGVYNNPRQYDVTQSQRKYPIGEGYIFYIPYGESENEYMIADVSYYNTVLGTTSNRIWAITFELKIEDLKLVKAQKNE